MESSGSDGMSSSSSSSARYVNRISASLRLLIVLDGGLHDDDVSGVNAMKVDINNIIVALQLMLID
jgi:hypothetical protein